MNDLLLEAREVTKNFGGLQAINQVNFQIRKGEIFSVIGPNGAGKTTLFNLITAFLPPTRGEIFFKGEKISSLKPFQVARRSIARTFQLTTLFEKNTVMENLMIGQRTTREMGILQALFGGPRKRLTEKIIWIGRTNWPNSSDSAGRKKFRRAFFPSGPKSNCQSGWPWPRIPSCCSSTNRRVG